MPSIDRLVFVALFSISGAALCSCSSGDDTAVAGKVGAKAGEDGPADGTPGSEGTKASGSEKTAADGTRVGAGRAPSGGATGTPGTGGTDPVAEELANPVGHTAPAPGDTPVKAKSKPDCAAADWEDPGTVPNPEVVAVAADAGKTQEQFGKSRDIDKFNYVEDEFFFTGTSPNFTSRMVVHRPKDAARFSGTVFMEWYNVTGGIDMGVMWALNREYLTREGHVHIGVSAQQVGANALKDYDAERYASINHPGDTAANAIFSQAIMAIRSQSELMLGPCMPVKTVLAGGQSQSSGYLAGYVDAVPAEQQLADGYLLHSGGTPTGDPPKPVFLVFTMAEGDGKLVDKPNGFKWEVAGASHSDAYISARGQVEQGTAVAIETKCASPMNEYPSFMVYNAAIDWLNKWVQTGERPPAAEPLQVGKMDEFGNALGGVRLQDIEVPIAKFSLDGAAAADPFDFLSLFVCGAGGSTTRFTPEQLLKLYPTHDDYVKKYSKAAEKARDGGFLLKADYDSAIKWAKSAPVPK